VDAMRGGGELKINYCRIEKGQVIVAIEDTGPGIPEEAWPTLFHPFATFRKKNGLGLGLALSRQTLLETGGDLWAERNVTAGARFIMRLPIASDGPEKLRRTGGRNDGHNS
jgi:C4-dicarboxylate-specific signal transduction histidine kinase